MINSFRGTTCENIMWNEEIENELECQAIDYGEPEDLFNQLVEGDEDDDLEGLEGDDEPEEPEDMTGATEGER